MKTLSSIAADLAGNKTTSADLVNACLDQIKDKQGQGGNTFRVVHEESAKREAEAIDRAREVGIAPSPWAGIPISLKDLFDVRGDVTTSGSVALADRPVAEEDALIVRRLRQAGFISVGRTNMTEFAYSGLGLNPHYGTPLGPWDRETGHIPGGSSSGAAVAQTDEMAYASIGTDTGGSCRIPAAFCGIVGFKPTAKRIPQQGVLPLSFSLDSIGVLANSVECCAITDAVMAGEDFMPLPGVDLRGLRMVVPQSFVLDGMDDAVAKCFQDTLSYLSGKGVTVVEEAFEFLNELPQINSKGGFAAAEAWAWHKDLIAEKADEYDPRVVGRIMKGEAQTAADYIELLQARQWLIESAEKITSQFDCMVCPTVPMLPPTFASLEDDEEYNRINLLALRNPSVGNMLDRCAISLPCHPPGHAPVGLMLIGAHGEDRRLLSVAQSVNAALGNQHSG